jgi:hypothetical protein
MEIRVIHAISGRLRLRLPRLRNDPTYASQIEDRVKELDFITSVRVNPLANSLIITYPEKTIAESEVESKLSAAIARLDATNAPSKFSANERPPENSDSQSEDMAKKRFESPAEPDLPKIAPLLEEKKNSLPLEPTPLLEKKSGSISSTVSSEESDSVKPTVSSAFKKLKLSQRELARRLGVSSRAIAIWCSKPNFTQWSMTKDPERIGWIYIKPLNKFYAVNQK